MKFCIVRLGKDSVDEIRAIDLAKGLQNRLLLNLNCKQVPTEADKSTYCFIWLGSDNNKGNPTEWDQGLRAFGTIISKSGGPSYNDEWTIKLRVDVVMPRSLKSIDLIRAAGSEFVNISDVPVIGLNTHSNQTVQMIHGDESHQDIPTLFKLLNQIHPDFILQAALVHPELNRIIPNLNFQNLEESVSVTSENLSDAFEEKEEVGTAVIIHPFDPVKIDIRPQPLTILSILKRLESNPMRIDLNTEFQRKGDLWEIENQSKLIESLLVRIPLPAFYFDGTSERWLIVDGLQRISALRNFILLKKFKLTGLEYLRDLEGFGWDDLPIYLQTRVEETSVTAYIINPGTPEPVKFNIFKRINTGGLTLTPQEIRHALNQGVPAKFVESLAMQPEFIAALGGKVPSDRMEDRDYVTRFIGFYLDKENYQPDLDSFLNSGMAKLKSLKNRELDEIRLKFIGAMKVAREIWGPYAFRKKYNDNEYRKPINKALFECISVSLAELSDNKLKILVDRKTAVDKGMMALLNNNIVFNKAISSGTGDVKAVERRYQGIKTLFDEITND